MKQQEAPATLSAGANIDNKEWIPTEKRRAMGDILDRWRLNQGWRPLDNNSQDLAIQHYVDMLDSENVPHKAYNELFRRALKQRARLFEQGRNAPEFGAELLLAVWPGLRDELRAAVNDNLLTLAENAKAACPDCHGTGYKPITRAGYTGVEKCNHVGS